MTRRILKQGMLPLENDWEFEEFICPVCGEVWKDDEYYQLPHACLSLESDRIYKESRCGTCNSLVRNYYDA